MTDVQLKYLKYSAEDGDVDDQIALGDYYLEDVDGKDYELAVYWFKKATSQNSAKAYRRLGDCYKAGKGLETNYQLAEENYQNAVTIWKKLAQSGDADAQYQLGNCYFFGYGVTQNYEDAVRWYLKAANQGYTQAQNDLGILYHEGGQGIPKSERESVAWFKMSAEQDDAIGQFNLALHYFNGNVADADEMPHMIFDRWDGIELLQKSAAQNYAPALFALGEHYVNGDGVPKNFAIAFDCFLKAAELGDKNGENYVGWYYKNGYAGEQDIYEAYKWFKKAAKHGHKEAIEQVKEINNIYHFE